MPRHTPENLLMTASRLLDSQPAETITTRAITRAAGVGTGAVNYHFAGKDELLHLAAMREVETFLASWPDRWGDLSGSPGSRLRAALASFGDFLWQRPHHATLWLQSELRASRSTDILLEVQAMLLPLVRQFSGESSDTALRVRAAVMVHTLVVRFLRQEAELREEWRRREFTEHLPEAVGGGG